MKRAALDYFPRCVRVRSLLFCLSSFTNERANVRMCVYLCIRRCELSAATAAFTSPTCVCVCVCVLYACWCKQTRAGCKCVKKVDFGLIKTSLLTLYYAFYALCLSI